MTVQKRRLPKADIDPPSAYVAPIGEIVLRWTRIEYQLAVIVRIITRLSKREQHALLDGEHAKNACRLLNVLAPTIVAERDRAVAADLLRLADASAKMADRRDNYVHSMYGHWHDDPATRMRFRPRKAAGGILPHAAMTPEELDGFATELRQLQVRAQDVTTKLKLIFGSRR